MPFLVILKRFEVWLLFALVAGLIVFALQPPPPLPGGSPTGMAPNRTAANGDPATSPAANPTPGGSPTEPSAAPGASLTVREVRVIPSSPGYIVETHIAGGPARGSDLILDENQVRATTADGQPVNRFFEPFQEAPVLLAAGDSVAALRWWLPAPATSLWIEIEGERIEAKLP